MGPAERSCGGGCAARWLGCAQAGGAGPGAPPAVLSAALEEDVLPALRTIAEQGERGRIVVARQELHVVQACFGLTGLDPVAHRCEALIRQHLLTFCRQTP